MPHCHLGPWQALNPPSRLAASVAGRLDGFVLYVPEAAAAGAALHNFYRSRGLRVDVARWPRPSVPATPHRQAIQIPSCHQRNGHVTRTATRPHRGHPQRALGYPPTPPPAECARLSAHSATRRVRSATCPLCHPQRALSYPPTPPPAECNDDDDDHNDDNNNDDDDNDNDNDDDHDDDDDKRQQRR